MSSVEKWYRSTRAGRVGETLASSLELEFSASSEPDDSVAVVFVDPVSELTVDNVPAADEEELSTEVVVVEVSFVDALVGVDVCAVDVCEDVLELLIVAIVDVDVCVTEVVVKPVVTAEVSVAVATCVLLPDGDVETLAPESV
jgi:hypothetical protein